MSDYGDGTLRVVRQAEGGGGSEKVGEAPGRFRAVMSARGTLGQFSDGDSSSSVDLLGKVSRPGFAGSWRQWDVKVKGCFFGVEWPLKSGCMQGVVVPSAPGLGLRRVGGFRWV